MTSAIIVVDAQRDFMPDGALPVPNGDEVIGPINDLLTKAYWANWFVVGTQDFHPADHGSFASQHEGAQPYAMGELNGQPQVMWPDHCVQDTEGAEFHPKLLDLTNVVCKGMDKGVDSYSGFFDNQKANSTGLHQLLQEAGVKRIFVCGLAFDFCVAFTAIDGAELGYETYLVEDATRAVDMDGSADKARLSLWNAGVRRISTHDVMLMTGAPESV